MSESCVDKGMDRVPDLDMCDYEIEYESNSSGHIYRETVCKVCGSELHQAEWFCFSNNAPWTLS